LVVAGVAFGSGAPAAPAATAADQPSSWPRKSVTIVVPFSPGGSTDQIARLFSTKLAEKLGQPFVVVNRPGAGTIVGMQEVVRARPDGYTLLLAV
ncbi:tripartite tricarboxylate transporter substrate-binding protein, partial [Klebsiella pneumoniae]|uniref:tripartite tricarboxylate transporter substrate-binding protein n=1 Tax=Klebsiella pneumoniae TaxID=573 RepID=UPI0021B112DD